MLAKRQWPNPTVAGVSHEIHTLIGITNAGNPERQVIHPDRDRDSSATPVLPLFLHEERCAAGSHLDPL